MVITGLTRNNGVRSTSGVRMGALTPWFITLPKSSIRQTMTNIDIENMCAIWRYEDAYRYNSKH